MDIREEDLRYINYILKKVKDQSHIAKHEVYSICESIDKIGDHDNNIPMRVWFILESNKHIEPNPHN